MGHDVGLVREGRRTCFDGSKTHEPNFTQPISNEEPLRRTAA